MKKYKWMIILLNLIFLLVYINYSTAQKEVLLTDGQLVLLELAPRDPRSFLQGDYMELRYKISQGRNDDDMPKRGYCVVKLDSKGVAERVRYQKGLTPKNENEHLIAYTSSEWNVSIGAESFFFQEGQAEKYEKAKYGGVRIDQHGHSLLIGLFDENLKEIK